LKKYVKLAILGVIFILIAIIIGILFEHDIAFLFCGTGIVMIGFAILTYIN